MSFMSKILKAFNKPIEEAAPMPEELVAVEMPEAPVITEEVACETQVTAMATEEPETIPLPSVEEQKKTIEDVRRIMNEHSYNFSVKFPIWMKCNLLMNLLHVGERMKKGETLEEINASVDWNKVNNFLKDSHVEYDYNIFDNITSITMLEELREEATMSSVLDDYPHYKQKCKKCGHDFTLSRGEIDWFQKKELNVPCRCRYCRKGEKRPEPVKVVKVAKPEPKETEKTAMQIAMEKAGIVIE